MGGEEWPVWPNAMFPEALPDGSLLGLHVIADKNQVFQFWPDTGKTIEFPVEVPTANRQEITGSDVTRAVALGSGTDPPKTGNTSGDGGSRIP
jgi:hypothetical protein